MTTPTTTYPLIRDQWVSTLQALVPAFLPDRFALFREGKDLRVWAAANQGAALRLFQVKRTGPRPQPGVSNLEVEQHELAAELVVAYPHDFNTFFRGGARGPRPLQDLEDVLDADGQQIAAALGINGAANYVAGQSACWAEPVAHEVIAETAILPIRLRVTFYRSV